MSTSACLSPACQPFRERLAGVLSELAEDQYLIISVNHSDRFAQFAGQGVFGLRAETTSNAFLPKSDWLDDAHLEALVHSHGEESIFVQALGTIVDATIAASIVLTVRPALEVVCRNIF